MAWRCCCSELRELFINFGRESLRWCDLRWYRRSICRYQRSGEGYNLLRLYAIAAFGLSESCKRIVTVMLRAEVRTPVSAVQRRRVTIK